MEPSVLKDVIRRFETLPATEWVYVQEGDLSEDTLVVVRRPGGGPEPGMRSFLSVPDFQDILYAWSEWRGSRKPSIAQAVRAIRFYDDRDAFIGIDDEP
jgi:hypothetical protein